jgi:hypothetical protein
MATMWKIARKVTLSAHQCGAVGGSRAYARYRDRWYSAVIFSAVMSAATQSSRFRGQDPTSSGGCSDESGRAAGHADEAML